MAEAGIDLSTPIQYLKGIGPKRGAALESIGIQYAGDLLYYYPRRYIDRRTITSISELKKDDLVTIVGEVVSMGVERGRKRRFKLIVEDGTGYISCVWFNGIKYVQNKFKEDQSIAIYGKVGIFGNQFTIVHPEFDLLGKGQNPLKTGAIIPIYPSTEELNKVKLDSNGMMKILKNFIYSLSKQLHDHLPKEVIAKEKLMELSEALRQIHFSDDEKLLEQAIYRIKYDELFFYQLLLAVRKQSAKTGRIGIQFTRTGQLFKSLFESLPFELTNSQKSVLKEIRKDMAKREPMQRLLQGDVGSGKTVVALLAASIPIGSGYQSAIMAPTEILSEQHYKNAVKLFKNMGLNIVQIIGGQSKSERKKLLDKVSSGEANLIIGTHALIYKEVVFDKLGFITIDEQHRFGVEQRAEIMKKGVNPDILIMSATPIPRSLGLSIYGDLDISVLTEIPIGARNVRSEWRRSESRNKIYEFIKNKLKEGGQTFIIYPLVEESEKMDLLAAKEGYQLLSEDLFKDHKLALLHGRLSSDEKESIMDDFSAGKIDLLIATTVIEVGIDVPNANVMLVENAERFGLSQLHQMRGRIGRSGEKSYFIMISDAKGEAAAKRLKVICETDNGFKIADEDLKQRGYGDFFGKQQHGVPNFKLADIINDIDIIKKARLSAFELIKNDPHLRSPANRLLRDKFMTDYSERLKFIETG